VAISPEVQRRISALNDELGRAANDEARNATRAYYWSQTLLILSLGCSAVAAICGIFFSISSRIVGGLAAVPPVIAYFAVSFRLLTRENWYYRKSIALGVLRSRLLFQLPEEPTVNHIASIAAERDKLVASMQVEWYETISKGYSESMEQRASKHQFRGTPPPPPAPPATAKE
jgi:hypothetical protein